MRPIETQHRLLRIILTFFGALIIAVPSYVEAQDGSNTSSAITRGIRHVLYLSIKTADPDVRFPQQGSDGPETATLTVKVRISDHALETNFFGDVSVTISEFDPIKGSGEQKVWEDAQCHHERSIPKLTVIGVDGTIVNGQQSLTIAARYRRLGLLMPADEVMAASRLSIGKNDHGSFVESRTQTKQSHLSVDLRLDILPCDLK
jgi:hypothetical protein